MLLSKSSALSAFSAIISIEKSCACSSVKSVFAVIGCAEVFSGICRSRVIPLSLFTISVLANAETFWASAFVITPFSTIIEMIFSSGRVLNCGFARIYEFILSSIVFAIFTIFFYT